FYGRWVGLEDLRELCYVSRDGTKASNLLRAAKSLGLNCKGLSRDIAGLSALPMPMIAFWNFNHFVVVEGLDAERVWLNDPATGPRTVTIGEFSDAFTGVVLVFEPGPTFTPMGCRPSLYSVIAENLRDVRGGIAFALAAGLLMVVPGIVNAGLSRIFLDEILLRAQSRWLAPLLIAMVMSAVLIGLLNILQRHMLARTQVALASIVSVRTMVSLMRQPLTFFSQRFDGDVANRVSQAERLSSLMSSGLVPALAGIVPIIGYGLAMTIIDPVLATIAVATVLSALGILALTARALEDGNRRTVNEEGRVYGATLQGLSMADDLRASGTESLFLARWLGAQGRYLTSNHYSGLKSQLVSEIANMLMTLATVAVLVVGGMRVMDGALTIGLLLAFQALMGSFSGPVLGLVGIGTQLQSIRGLSERLHDTLHRPTPSLAPAPAEAASRELEAGDAFLEMEGVSYSFGPMGQSVIENFSLTVPVGARVALVGASGSGKSTLGRLMVGLLAPVSGTVRIAGRRIEEWEPGDLRRALGYVDQNIGLFQGTIRDNITLWDDTLPEEYYTAAARDAAIHDFITGRPGGYAERVLEQGRNFSGGERQRLALARALAINPGLMVLDEATSAVDPVVEKEIMDAIRRRGCTCLVIAHRLSSIRDSDLILVLERGRVIEQGRHHELLARQGAYARLLES
ncbi:MAG: ATP-binding cassette domain-containing protein, partial [Magnetospirillum sp.]